MKPRARTAIKFAVLIACAIAVQDMPGGVVLLLPLGLLLWWGDKNVLRSRARDRWLELDCAAAIRGSHQRPDASQAAMDRHKWSAERQVLLRYLQVFGKSAHLVRTSKNPKTVIGRRLVAQRAMSEALAMRDVMPRAQFWRLLQQHAEGL